MADAYSAGWQNISIVTENSIRRHWSGGCNATDHEERLQGLRVRLKASWGPWRVIPGQAYCCSTLLVRDQNERAVSEVRELRWFLASLNSRFYHLIPLGFPHVHFCCYFSCPASLPLVSFLLTLSCSPDLSLFFELIIQMTCLKLGADRVTFCSKYSRDSYRL